jgi:uncharacterized protein with HEPN domain
MLEYEVYLNLIIEMVDKIERSLKKSIDDEDVWDAVLMRFQVIGESVNNIPKKIRDNHSEINWRKFYGFRNGISHEYLNVPKTIVMSLINELPSLKKTVIKIKGEIKK